MNPEQEQEWREEANRLKILRRDVQRQIIDIHRSTANDPRAAAGNREHARERADALERFLGLPKKKR